MNSDMTIIIVSYNSASVIIENWKKFLDITKATVIIVDNASSDGSDQLLSQLFPHVRVVKLEQNIGYGRAANEGFSLCESRFALLLNPDLVVSEDAVFQLFSLALKDSDNTAIWAPVINESDCSSQPPQSVEAVSGAAMLFDFPKIKNVGLFDDKIFLYSEESDLCYRTRQAGYSIKLCPRVYLKHFGDGSSGHDSSLALMKSWHFGWSRCYFYHKHGLDKGKRSAVSMYRNYKLKSYLNLNSMSRFDYRGKAAGVKAFLQGKGAFRSDGTPQKLQLRP